MRNVGKSPIFRIYFYRTPSVFIRWRFSLIICGFLNPQPFHRVLSSDNENHGFSEGDDVKNDVKNDVKKSPET